jgi:hypothetical protein
LDEFSSWAFPSAATAELLDIVANSSAHAVAANFTIASRSKNLTSNDAQLAVQRCATQSPFSAPSVEVS